MTAKGRGRGRSRGQQWRLADDGLDQGLAARGDGGEAQRGQRWLEIRWARSGRGLLGRRRGNSWTGLDIVDPEEEEKYFYSTLKC